jgi:hypothetical protein
MRKILLKLANRIYKKYGFQEIREGQLFVFKDDIYRVVKTTLKQDVGCIDELTVKLHKRETLTSYISEKLRNKR